MPPVVNKRYNDIFNQLWKEAQRSLKEADEIIVIGYSFRKADEEARNRIGCAIAGNANSQMLTTVDKNPDEIRTRILEISGKDANIFKETFYSFEKFLAS